MRIRSNVGSTYFFRRLTLRRAGPRNFRPALRLFLVLLQTSVLSGMTGCSGGGESFSADNGGIGGTGISQGSITAFGSIYVNGVEWDLGGASIEVDGAPASEADLRIGMKVRVTGDFAAGGLSGSAISVQYDDSTEGPIADTPILILPAGTQKSFTILGQTIFVDVTETVFADGASFASLAMNQVLEVSGFEEGADTIRATRVALRGSFPAVSDAKLRGSVTNLSKNPDGSGIFEILDVTVRYLASTDFSELTRNELAEGLDIEVSGDLRPTGDELDADEIELEDEGLGQQDAEDVELEGIVSDFVSISDFRLAGIPVDASSASIEPPGFSVANGAEIEVEGRLTDGVIFAEELESEEDEEAEVDIEAAASSVDAAAREVTILGVVVVADGETELEDERDGDENFRFDEIQPGDWLEIDGFEIGTARVRAKKIRRESQGDDVILQGEVSALDRLTPALSVLGQPIPLDPTTSYFDSLGQSRTEEQFFRTPGDVDPGDEVVVKDTNATFPDVLGEADEVELE